MAGGAVRQPVLRCRSRPTGAAQRLSPHRHPLHPGEPLRRPGHGEPLLLRRKDLRPGEHTPATVEDACPGARTGRTLRFAVNRRAAALAVVLLALVDARAAPPTPAPSSSSPPAVRIRDRSLVEVRLPLGERSAEVR